MKAGRAGGLHLRRVLLCRINIARFITRTYAPGVNPATMMTMAADFPAPLTPNELDRLLGTLSASERAELSWARPGFAAALDGLITGPLNREALDAATRMFARVTLGLKRVMRKMAQGNLPYLAVSAAVGKRRHRLVTFLGSEMLVAHVEQAANAIEAFFESVKADLPRALAQLLDDERDIDDLLDAMLQTPSVGLLRAEVVLAALFEIEDKSGSPERGRDLARLALVTAVDFVTELRANGVTNPFDEPGPPLEDEDKVLSIMADRALRGTPDEAARAGQWVSALMPQHAAIFSPELPAVEIPRPRTRLTRHVGEVTSVQLTPIPAVALLSEGTFKWFTATTEIVERAWALHGAPVEVLALHTSGGPEMAAWGTLTGRLVRIDPASEDQAPDSATRTRDMLRIWDKLLHRLAR